MHMMQKLYIKQFFFHIKLLSRLALFPVIYVAINIKASSSYWGYYNFTSRTCIKGRQPFFQVQQIDKNKKLTYIPF